MARGAVALIANTAATVAVLAVLIALLGPISGAHFNPAVSFIEALRGNLSVRATIAYAIVQILGCVAGAFLAHAMFELPIIQSSMHLRAGPAQWLSEAVATAGLILVVIGSAGSNEAAWRVAAWIGAAYRSLPGDHNRPGIDSPSGRGPNQSLKDRRRAGLLNFLILRHRSRRQGLRAETSVLASALRAALTAALR